MTLPEPRNSSALKKACVTRWKMPALTAAPPVPTARNMYPSWEIVEYARTFLMSHCLSAIVAANSAVNAPTPATTALDTGAMANSRLQRATRYTPAVTIVAAWINAETGVGPAIASGNQVYRGICADLPVQPRNRKSVIAVMEGPPATSAVGACAKTVTKSSDPVDQKIMNIATKKPKAPMRCLMNALRPAVAFAPSLAQKPISRLLQRPTPCRATN